MSTDWLTKTHENVNGLDKLNFEQTSAIFFQCIETAAVHTVTIYPTSISFFKKAGGHLALSLYVFLLTACFHFELLELYM